MRIPLIILATHFVVGVCLGVGALLDDGAASFFCTLAFFLWNMLGVWTLKGLGVGLAMESLPDAYALALLLIVSQAVIAVILLLFRRARGFIGA